jgi:hypothetical protein
MEPITRSTYARCQGDRGVDSTSWMPTLEHTLPAHLAQWRVSVSSSSADQDVVDAFLLDCTGKNGCSVTDQKPVNPNGVILTADEPKQGNWRIVIRVRDAVKEPDAFRVREAQLVPNYSASESADAKHASGTTWSVVLPAKVSDAREMHCLAKRRNPCRT